MNPSTSTGLRSTNDLIKTKKWELDFIITSKTWWKILGIKFQFISLKSYIRKVQKDITNSLRNQVEAEAKEIEPIDYDSDAETNTSELNGDNMSSDDEIEMNW